MRWKVLVLGLILRFLSSARLLNTFLISFWAQTPSLPRRDSDSDAEFVCLQLCVGHGFRPNFPGTPAGVVSLLAPCVTLNVYRYSLSPVIL